MLRYIRITLATIFFVLITLLFLDFTGTIQAWFDWMAKIQFLPAVLAVNVVIIIALILLTLIFGRVYCSIICPMGVFQDIISHLHRKKNRFSHSPALTWLRSAVLVIFIILLLIPAVSFIAKFIAPYSAFGRIASAIFAPIYELGNNVLAYFAERADSYTFYSVDVWIKGALVPVVAIATFIIIGVLAWLNGRTWCNTICPVGTVLGFLSKFSIFKIKIDAEKCNKCSLCSRNCKSSCIDFKNHKIDYSRCVTCGNCIGKCHQKAISYGFAYGKKTSTQTANTTDNMIENDNVEMSPIRVETNSDNSANTTRRNFLAVTTLFAATSAIKAQQKTTDGGLAKLVDRKIPVRQTKITPPGSHSIRNFAKHCTACQLCISVCPNQVLRPSNGVFTLMQPEMSYERGYCRPECTRCSEVCPTGAIDLITRAEKSATHIGHAVWVMSNCIVQTDEVSCGNCARHCPVGAISMVAANPDDPKSPKFPSVNPERCIGCGACEYVCPARPFSAIYVEGNENHREG